jgi:glycosyltransferase involved in cell wall biosynthesis
MVPWHPCAVPELVVLTEQLLAPVPGGTGRYTRELTAALAATAPGGWEVTGVVARHGDVSAAAVPGTNGPRVLPVPPRALVAAWEYGMPWWPGGDAVHAPTPLAPPRAPRGRSLVVTVHDTVPWTVPETLTPRGARWHRKVVSRATRQASSVVVPTAAVAADLTRYAPGRAPLHVVGHGVPDTLLAEPSDTVTREVINRYQLPDRYVLAVGTVEPRKGLDVLIDALTRDDAPDLPLVIAGPRGWGDVAVTGLPPERLRILGRVTDADLAVIMRCATVLAAPSRAEGFGMPLLEAMALGIPVVHSDAPALVEVAAGTGRTVPRQDPAALARTLQQVTDDPTETARLVTAARDRAAQFSWKTAAQTIWRLHLDP